MRFESLENGQNKIIPHCRLIKTGPADKSEGDSMTKRIIIYLLSLTWIVSAAQTGKITGIVIDADTGEPLPGANVVLQGTAIGAATDLEGIYFMPNVPAGQYEVKVMYVGYGEAVLPVEIKDDETSRLDIELRLQVFEGETVEVTAQLEGQARAINQQLSANTIVNVVSSDKIQALPDQNAAESLGRLPGIAVQRDAGEGQKVIVRGLAPKFNSVTVNGERIPATDPSDRSVDLTMISSDMLAGIEVFKALTPDKDADAVGGTVNFVTKKAEAGWQGDIRIQSGYNQHADDFGIYRGNVSVGNRFFNSKFGVLLTGSIQRANRSSHALDSDYVFTREMRVGETRAPVGVAHLNLVDRIEIRDRYGASMILDYALPGGNIMLNSFWGKTERDELRRRRRYNIDAYRTEFTMRDRQIDINLWSNALSGEHRWADFDISWRGSYSISKQNTPFLHYVRFYEDAGFSNDLIDDQGPTYIPAGAKNNLDLTWFKYSSLEPEKVDDRDLTLQVDFRYPFNFGKNLAGYLKFGGKLRDKDRQVDKYRYWSNHFGINQLGELDDINRWEKDADSRVLVTNFLDPGFDAENFLDGTYTFGPGLDRNKINDFYYEFRNYTFPNGDPLYIFDPLYDLQDYNAGEQIIAGYLMTEVDITGQLMVLPGVRYEKTRNDYKSIFGTPRSDDPEQKILGLSDTTGFRSYDHFLPMFHIKYKPLDWFDVRLAATKSLTRPDYYNLVPRRALNERTLEVGNPDLKPTTAWNYDLFLSFYNKYGLLTIGGFYKELKNIDYIRRARDTGELGSEVDFIEGPVNSDYLTKVRGFEIEIQTNLRLLPSPFDGFVIYLNYAHISSETPYPFLKVVRGGPPFFEATFIDTFRVERMPGQADHLANVTLGYEKGGFSARISGTYQGKMLMTIGTRSEFDGYTDAYLRWDLAVQQKLGYGLSFYANFNNITNREEGAYLSVESYPTSLEYFGWTADLGIRYKF